MAISYFGSELAWKTDAFANALLVSEHVHLDMFDNQTQGRILRDAMGKALERVKMHPRNADLAAIKATELANWLRVTVDHEQFVDSDIKRAISKETSIDAKIILHSYLGNDDALMKIANDALSISDFETAEEAAALAGQSYSRQRIRGMGIRALKNPFNLRNANLAFDYLNIPMKLSDKEMLTVFRSVQEFSSHGQHHVFPATYMREEIFNIFNIAVVDSISGNRKKLLHYGKMALENGLPVVAHMLYRSFYKPVGKGELAEDGTVIKEQKEGVRYLNAVRKCRDLALEKNDYLYVLEFSRVLGEELPWGDAYDDAISKILSGDSCVKNGFMKCEKQKGSHLLAYMVGRAQGDDLVDLENKLSGDIKGLEDVEKLESVNYILLDQVTKYSMYLTLLHARSKLEDKNGVLELLQKGLKEEVFSKSIFQGTEWLGLDDGEIEELKTYIPASQKDDSAPKELKQKDKKGLMRLISEKLPEDKVKELYGTQGINAVYGSVMKVLDELDGWNVDFNDVSCVGSCRGGWISLVDDLLETGKIEAKATDYEELALICFSEGNVGIGRFYLQKAVELSGCKPEDSSEALKTLAAEYKEQILSGLVATATTNTIGYIPHDDLIRGYELIDMEVPPVLYVRAGIAALNSVCDERLLSHHQDNQTVWKLDTQRLWSAWNNFTKAKDRGMIDFLEKNFPTQTADYQRQAIVMHQRLSE
jgi:hypothetical protein